MALLAVPVILWLTGCYMIDFKVNPNVFDCNFYRTTAESCAERRTEYNCESQSFTDVDASGQGLCRTQRCTESCSHLMFAARNCSWFGGSELTAGVCGVLVDAAGCSRGHYKDSVFGGEACFGYFCTDTDCPQ